MSVKENQSHKIFPIILSGGAGTRLWPLSRAAFPKQFLTITGDNSLFHATLERVNNPDIFQKPLIVCSQKHRFLIRDILSEMKREADIVMEPAGRNTAPALLAAALSVHERAPEAVMLVMPSDHLINNADVFIKKVQQASDAAQRGYIALFGIPPTHANTEYGYIRRGEELRQTTGIYKIDRFTEKPDEARASEYLKYGGYDWNSGIFVMRADHIIEEIKNLAPDIYSNVHKAWEASQNDLGDLLLEEQAFKSAPDLSIDYAVMEKTDKSCVIPASFDWDDLGSWDSLMAHADQDENGTAAIGTVLHDGVKNSYLRSDGPVLCAVDVDDIIAVATKDTVMITKRGQSSGVSRVIKALKAKSDDELCYHKTWPSKIMAQ